MNRCCHKWRYTKSRDDSEEIQVVMFALVCVLCGFVEIYKERQFEPIPKAAEK